MPPKSVFTIPLGNVKEIQTETRRTKRSFHTSTKEVPFYSAKPTRSGQPSVSKSQANTNVVQAQISGLIPEDIEESHQLPAIDVKEDDNQDFQTDNDHSKSNVRFTMHLCTSQGLIVSRHQ